jgi:excisionase family DNA binding protein
MTVHDTARQRWMVGIPEAYAGLGVGRSTFYELVARGDMEVVRVGRRVLVPVDAIEAYVQRLRDEQTAPPAA